MFIIFVFQKEIVMKNTVFITGGSTGIGRASVLKFLSQGWNISIADIDKETALELIDNLNKPESLLFCEADTRNPEQLQNAVDKTVQKFGKINSVFVNAGIHRNNTLLNISREDLQSVIDINLYGSIYTLQSTVPRIIEAGGGSIVINCSDQWFIGKANSFAYGLTKGALGQMTRSLSIDLAKYNIRVNAICPGSIHTPLLDKALKRASMQDGASDIKELYRLENEQYARHRMGQPKEVAELVFFLASEASSFCTGGHYLIDGGLVAQ